MASSPPRAPLHAAALLTVGVFLLAGCGSGGTPETRAARPAAPPTVTVGGSQVAATGGTAPAPGATEATEATEATQATGTVDGQGGKATATVEAGMEQVEQPAVTIIDFAYEVPGPVPPGSTVTVVNDDAEAHTVTSSGAFNISVTSGRSATFTAPDVPGEYTITCLLHGNMTDTLVVG